VDWWAGEDAGGYSEEPDVEADFGEEEGKEREFSF
jgi:hypothetical protein